MVGVVDLVLLGFFITYYEIVLFLLFMFLVIVIAHFDSGSFRLFPAFPVSLHVSLSQSLYPVISCFILTVPHVMCVTFSFASPVS